MHDVKDISLAKIGRERIDWAGRQMPVVAQIREKFNATQPFNNIRISACLHVTSETANLVLTLKEGGAEVVLCASNPLSTQDDVAAALVSFGISTNAINNEDEETYYNHINTTLNNDPHLTIDDGADLVTTLHTKRQELITNLIGGTEETTTGVIRLRSMAASGKLKYPIIAVNDAHTKYLFDNRYGTGQSTIDGITRATNIMWAGKKVVVCGYGWCGRGIAMRARGLGAQVIIVEVEALRALEAVMDGYQVMTLLEAAQIGDIFITATGNINVIDHKHLEKMKDGAILANSGHFNVEINLIALKNLSRQIKMIRHQVKDYLLKNNRHLYLLGEGRLINLAAAEGHPASVMDMSFANQALSLEYLIKHHGEMESKVYDVPQEIDRMIATLKLESMGINIDNLTKEQQQYLTNWEKGT